MLTKDNEYACCEELKDKMEFVPYSEELISFEAIYLAVGGYMIRGTEGNTFKIRFCPFCGTKLP